MVGRRSRFFVLIASLLMLAANAFAMHPNVRTHRTRHLRRHLRRVAWKPLFRGSHDMLVRQNEEIDRLELPRIEDNDELAELEESRELVPVKPARSLEVAENLAPTRRYCRPWTREFLEDLSAAYYEKFHRPIRVNSLVRTVEQQRKLRRHNRNAAPVEGDTASTHLTGMTVDIAKRGMTRAQHRWMEQYLLPLQQQGLIEPVEERRQAVFHVMVYNSYSDWRKSKKTPPDAASKTVSN